MSVSNPADDEAVRAAYRTIMASVQRAQPSAIITGVTVEPMLMHKHARELFIGVWTTRCSDPP